MKAVMILLAQALLGSSVALPLPEVIPPPVKRAGTTHMIMPQKRAPPSSSAQAPFAIRPPAVASGARAPQMLVQAGVHLSAHQDTETNYYVDDAGDTHIGQTEAVDNTVVAGTPGSTDGFMDEEFYLNVPYDEMEFNEKVNVTWVRPSTLVTNLDYIGLYLRTDSDDAIPCNWEFASGTGATGSLSLQMTNYGEMELRYFDVAGDRPRVRLPVTVYPPCPNNCTNHGDCEKGVCQCRSPYKGEECCLVGGSITFGLNTTKVTVGEGVAATLTPPVGELDKRNWVGIFPAESAEEGDTHMQLLQTQAHAREIMMMEAQQGGNSSNATDEPEFIDVQTNPPAGWKYVNDFIEIGMPHKPGKYVLKVVQNILTHPVLGSSEVITVVDVCPNNCSGHGKCVDGVCVCDDGYQGFPDCSVGDGMVQMSANVTECTEGALVRVSWERNTDGGFTNMDYIALFSMADDDFNAPFAYQFAQAEQTHVSAQMLQKKPADEVAVDKAVAAAFPPVNHALVQLVQLGEGEGEGPNVDRGFVDFNAPMQNGTYVFRYFRRDHVQYAMSNSFDVYEDCAVPTCTYHGDCVRGVCECYAGWTTFDCSVGEGDITVSHGATTKLVSSELAVAWTRPVKKGSVYDFVAMYSPGEPNDRPLSYAYAHDESDQDATSGSVKLPVPHAPGIYSVRYIDAFTRDTIASASDIEAHLPCPNECSGHGTCVKDTCMCEGDWTARDDCSAKVGITEITATPLSVVTPSDAEITVSYKRPEGSGSTIDFIGLFKNGTANVRHPLDFKVPGAADLGTVKFKVPASEGYYYVKYIGGPSSEMRARSLGIDVTKACLNQCTGHGTCNRGVCDCFNGWSGEDCSIGLGPTVVTVGPQLGNPGDTLVITYSRPANTGSDQDFLAIYKQGATEMGSPYAFVMATNEDSASVEGSMPNVEEVMEVHYVSGTDQSSKGVSGPFTVVFPCPEDCNAHGDCAKGVCNCYSGWAGMSCNEQIPTAFAVRLTSGGTVEPLGNSQFAWDLVPAQATASDYVGIFAVTDTSSSEPLIYEYTSLQPSGTTTLMAPQQAGDYVGRYICMKGGAPEVKAESATLSVVPPPKDCPQDCCSHGTCDSSTGECTCGAGWAGLDCCTEVPTEWVVVSDANQYIPGGWIEARWTRPPETGNYLDRIFITKVGSQDPLQVQYVGVGNMGVLNFAVPTPAGETAQAYQLRFGNGATGSTEASSEPFTVLNDGVGGTGRRARHSQH